MTPQEINQLLKITTANYPNMQERDLKPTAELWLLMLTDIPFEVAKKAVIKVLSTAKFFPTIAEIREAAVMITQPYIPSAPEAWGQVIKAVKNYGFYRELEALESLPPSVAKTVRQIGWRDICHSEEPDVIRGQFRRAWEAQTTRDKELAVIPNDIRNLITSTTKQLGSGLKLVSGGE